MAQIDGKWVKTDTLDETKVRPSNDSYMQARNALDSADINAWKVNASDLVEFGVQPQFNGTPSAGIDLVNINYLNAAIAGQRDPKDACRLATVAALPANTLAATGPGTPNEFELTASANGALSVDGIAVANGDRILVKNEAAGQGNGIYIVDDLGSAGTPYVLQRAADADNVGFGSEVQQGMSTMIAEGTNARKLYLLSTSAITINTTPLVFVQVPNPANFLVPFRVEFTLAGAETELDLAHVVEVGSVKIHPIGGPRQDLGVDYTVTPIEPANSNLSRIVLAGDLLANNQAGEIFVVEYSYATS